MEKRMETTIEGSGCRAGPSLACGSKSEEGLGIMAPDTWYIVTLQGFFRGLVTGLSKG